MDKIRRLEEIFGRFPGIGPRQAKRFVYHILTKSPSAIREFLDLVEEVRLSSHECSLCHRFYVASRSAEDKEHEVKRVCPTCLDASRDKSILMVVSRDSDYESIEKSGAYRGLYFVLGGSVPVLDKDPEKRIRLKALLERVLRDSGTEMEIILSMNTTPDGEHTAEIVRAALVHLFKNGKTAAPAPRITILGRGLSTGAELEYADNETIRNALENRR